MTEKNLEERMEAVRRKMAAVSGEPAPAPLIVKPFSQEDYKDLLERLDHMCLSPTGATKAALMTIHRYVVEWRRKHANIDPSAYGNPTEKSELRVWGFPEKFVKLYEVVMGQDPIAPPIYSIPAGNTDTREIFKSSIRASNGSGNKQ